MGRKHTPESRAKISAALKGKPASEKMLAHLRKVHEGNTGKARSPETRAKQSTALRGKYFPDRLKPNAKKQSVHKWLRIHFPKTGICETCGEERGARGARGTHFAFLHHPDPYTRNREDYRELCPRCHLILDGRLPLKA